MRAYGQFRVIACSRVQVYRLAIPDLLILTQPLDRTADWITVTGRTGRTVTGHFASQPGGP